MKNKNNIENVICVFLKAPVKGFVKTRLAATIGEDAALKLYTQFVKHTLDILSRTDYAIHAYFYPAHKRERLRELVGDGIPVFPQQGTDLGERMKNAMVDAFSKGFTKAVLIGTDIPGLNAGIINDGVLGLDDYPAVIGPSTDGGYYLIGFSSSGFVPEIFTDMPWGTRRVLKKTMSVFEKKNMNVHMLSQCRDIDTYEDLHAFLSENESTALNYRDIIEDIHPGLFR